MPSLSHQALRPTFFNGCSEFPCKQNRIKLYWQNENKKGICTVFYDLSDLLRYALLKKKYLF